jgi:hypothetical protein
MDSTWQSFLDSSTSLKQTFDLARLYFNERNWDEVEGLLDNYVVLKRVRHADSGELVIGKNKVMDYLRNQVKDHPKFDPQPSTQTIDENLGAVYGLANWTDDNGNDTIRYFFLFTKQSGDWKLLFLWGSDKL